MGRPIKNPKAKIEFNVTQILKRLRILRGMADGGYIDGDQLKQIEDAVSGEAVALKKSVNNYKPKEEQEPFTL